jgi:hypothetical protein
MPQDPGPRKDAELLEKSKKDPGANFTRRAQEDSMNTRRNQTPQAVPGGPYGPNDKNTQYERK